MVEHFNRNAHAFEDQGHFGAHVLRAVNRRHWEVTTFDRRAVTAVAAFHFGTTVPGCFVVVDLEERTGHVAAETNVVEQEEFWLWTKVSCIAQTGSLQISFSALGDRTGVTVIGFAITGLQHVASQDQSCFFEEGVNIGCDGIGHQQHVGGFDAFPTGNGRTVERMAISELAFVKVGNWH